MRPRLNAAENAMLAGIKGHGSTRFNEAAAKRRGKRKHICIAGVDFVASMRPRLNAAENSPRVLD